MTDAGTAQDAGSTAGAALSAIDTAFGPGHLLGLGLALAIGMLIGIERGWQFREEQSGSRVAGVRTFSLLGLLGGLAGLAVQTPLSGIALLLTAAAALAILLGYRADMQLERNVSATSAIAAVLTILLGATAAAGAMAVAAVGAGAVAILLAMREQLHRALADTSEPEIKALMRLVLVVFVILPLLPDKALGPYALNPRRLWTAVVTIGSVSFVGYVLVRLIGGRRAALLTAVMGALVSSTAVTVECARKIRAGEAPAANQAAIAVAATVMMVRATLLVVVLIPQIIGHFLPLIVPAAILSALISAVLAYLSKSQDAPFDRNAVRPPGLGIAFLFGVIVLLTAVAAGWAEQHFRGGGAAIVAVSGLFDVDSAIAALGTIAPGTLSVQLSAFAVAAPVIFNTVLKAGLAIGIGGVRNGWVPAAALLAPALVILGTILAIAL